MKTPPLKVLAPAVLLVTLIFLFAQYSQPYLPSTQAVHDAVKGSIPNKVHFVYILSDPAGDFSFEFSHYLSIFAAWHLWHPHTIYLSTNAEEASVARAREGKAGKWSKLVFDMPGVKMNYVSVPTHADNGVEIKGMEHKSDFVRVKAMYELGGVYIDFDVHPLRDIKILRESGFNAVAGRQLGGQVNSGVFMSKKGGKMVKLWMDGMHEAYTGGWTTHSNEVITKFGERLVSEPGEMLIMEREAFAPGSWNAQDSAALFEVHNVTSNLENVHQGDAVASFDETFSERWNEPKEFPDWAQDWSRTYMLHAFSPARFGDGVEGFEHITPRYVLERRSNFARAVYPIAKVMYEKDLIAIDDSYLGS